MITKRPSERRLAPEGVKTFEQGPWPGLPLVPWSDAADGILWRLTGRRLTREEIDHVRRVAAWLEDQGDEPVSPTARPVRPAGDTAGGKLSRPKVNGLDATDLGD